MPKPTSFRERFPSSPLASRLARASSRKSDTRPERLLRKVLWSRGLRYRKSCNDLPGKPDLVFRSARVAVFCDGDFWHGRDWAGRKVKLAKGSNPDYWVAKIERNRERDRQVNRVLQGEGWTVLRFWETDIVRNPDKVAELIERAVGIPSSRA